MHADEQAIRVLVRDWLRASAAGELDRVLALMSDDVVFLTPGQKPFGKEAFAAASRASHGKVRIDTEGEIQEVQIAGDLAFCRTRLVVTATPAQGGEAKRLSGHTLSVLRKQQDGRWLLVRDANLLTVEPRRPAFRAAVPVFQVVDVNRSIGWYREALGFTADPFGPPEAPVFAGLARDGVELMLQKSNGTEPHPSTAERGWNLYLRVADVGGVRDAVRVHLPNVPPIVTRPYGCREFEVADPDGHILVFGQCD